MSRVETLAEGVTLYLGDCREVLPTLPKVDAIVTSPPYDQQREYGQRVDDWGSLVAALATMPAYPHTQILVNLGLVFHDGEVVEYWEPFKQDMRAAGWRFFGWYVWDKGGAMPAGDLNRPPCAHEWILHFNKQSRPPTKWVVTQERKDIGRGIRQFDGSLNGITSPDRVGQPYKVPDSVIRLPAHQARGGPESGHPAVFPVPFARHLCLTFSADNDIVCDPFMGSGTTGVAAVKLGRKFIGIEIEEKYFDIACRRISDALREPDMFIERPKPAKQEALKL